MGKELIRLTGEDNLMIVYALKLKILLDFLLLSVQSNQIIQLARAQFSQTLFLWWVKHQKSLERVSRSSQPSPPAAVRCAPSYSTRLRMWRSSRDDSGLWSGEYLTTRLNVRWGSCLHPTLFILERLAGFALLKKLTSACKYRKKALQESQQELRDQAKVQQTPPWSQWHLTLMVGGDGVATLARQTDQSHFKWDAEDTWEQSIFKLD